MWERRQVRRIAEDVNKQDHIRFLSFNQTATKKWAGQCETCNRWYEATRSDKRFCSLRCYWQSRNQCPDSPVTCKVCSTRFDAVRKGHIYCSDKCRCRAYRVRKCMSGYQKQTVL